MKKKHIILTCLVHFLFSISCSDNEENGIVNPNELNVLGLVIPDEGVSKLLLLEDGRIINPISGVSNFNKISTGTKALISFSAVENQTGVIDAHVSAFNTTTKEEFILSAKNNGSEQTLSGKFTGDYYYMTEDSSVFIDSNIELTFDNDTYSYTSAQNQPLDGSGTFTSTDDEISFIELSDWPAEVNLDHVLQGNYSYSLSPEGQLFLYIERENKSVTVLSLQKESES